MTNLRKDAGQARQRPRRPAPPSPETSATSPVARPAGIAPAFDAAAQQLAARTDAPKGMISNPWVRQWASGSSSANPSDVASPLTQEPSPAAEAAPRREARRSASDAGHAPTPKAHG
jgi:hypothetical protein